MASSDEELLRKVCAYADSTGQCVERQLGFGVQGSVYQTDQKTAIKAHERERAYWRERDVYFRLREFGVFEIASCSVPQLIHHDDELFILEMTIVQPPFVLDFGGAYLDRPPEFPAETMAEWEAEKREQFGDDWPAACGVLGELKSHGIHMVDVNPGNIRFRN